MKGIILAGGSGSRLYPLTLSLNKHLLPVYDKPLIYYPLSTLMLANIRDILIITRPEDLEHYQAVLKDGNQWGMSLSYATQDQPNGIAEAIMIGASFVGQDPFALILGDNIFFGPGFRSTLVEAAKIEKGATIFSYWVSDPERYGVVNFDSQGSIISIEEKPKIPTSNLAITGLYFYDSQAIDLVKSLKPSARGELEITDLNQRYLDLGQLKAVQLNRGFAWLDAGTHSALMDASNYIATIEKRQGLKIGCPEEIAWRQQWITDQQYLACYQKYMSSDYGNYLIKLYQQQHHESPLRVLAR